MSQVHGNITGIRDSQLAELEAIYDCPFEPDEFAPRDLLLELARHSHALNREIAVLAMMGPKSGMLYLHQSTPHLPAGIITITL